MWKAPADTNVFYKHSERRLSLELCSGLVTTASNTLRNVTRGAGLVSSAMACIKELRGCGVACF